MENSLISGGSVRKERLLLGNVFKVFLETGWCWWLYVHTALGSASLQLLVARFFCSLSCSWALRLMWNLVLTMEDFGVKESDLQWPSLL